MTTYSIPAMSCGHCKATVEKTVLALDPAATLSFDMPARTVAIDSGRDDALLRAALKDAGYPAVTV
ncbi:heavy-metal-associated domain-containing protein [Loktanella sp. M215]|uniref:heavy-metal-associated domain-containing protein n=1 Tax=Loktanella sp. M215 TaxID=2675431 RepID=UPI001F3D7B7C|nr:heavy-metal-associated domain-containing protein [Loktanella sp. M215]MBU2358231.1 heavy-metal-associated domain-containing protein [Alphaproteobacteria bacterium]MCF7701957.1 copper chaperone [Loktanella sp. M215]